jgi:hypothetical protein
MVLFTLFFILSPCCRADDVASSPTRTHREPPLSPAPAPLHGAQEEEGELLGVREANTFYSLEILVSMIYIGTLLVGFH